MKIESRDVSLDELLTANYFFIPRFQRPYSWDDENINDFWSDISDNIGTNYFIGSMVAYKKGDNTLGVVDGQQRLTTITILLCTIRDHFEAIGAKDKAKVCTSLLKKLIEITKICMSCKRSLHILIFKRKY